MNGAFSCTNGPPDLAAADLAPYTSCPPEKFPQGAPCAGYFDCLNGLDENYCLCNGGPLFTCFWGHPDLQMPVDLSVPD